MLTTKRALMATLASILCLPVPALHADELTDAKARLEKAGLRVTSSSVSNPREAELAKELGKVIPLKRNLVAAQAELVGAERQVANLQRSLAQLKQQHVQLSLELANINAGNVTLNNRLVGALDANAGQQQLAAQQLQQLEAQLKAARAKASEAREAYVQFVLDTRKLADSIEAEFVQKAADPEIKAALAKLSQAGKPLTLTPSSTFQTNLRRLKGLEDTILAESIDLRTEGGTLWVSTVINGKHQVEMVLDSGASIVSLPHSVAQKIGLRPTDKDPRIILQLADGSQIEGRQMTIPSLRVGKFAVENVTCAVLDERAVAAEPLLGMSFLEHFKFEINAAASSLTMVKVAGTESAAAARAK
jgi:aspartyl protease family protein